MCEPPHCFQQKADKIAKKCIDLYMSLPKNGKPEPGKEWTVLAGIVQENVSIECTILHLRRAYHQLFSHREW